MKKDTCLVVRWCFIFFSFVGRNWSNLDFDKRGRRKKTWILIKSSQNSSMPRLSSHCISRPCPHSIEKEPRSKFFARSFRSPSRQNHHPIVSISCWVVQIVANMLLELAARLVEADCGTTPFCRHNQCIEKLRLLIMQPLYLFAQR